MKSVIATHSGTFHCDEVFACWMLRCLPQYKSARIVRTRDPALLSDASVVVDVGGEYDPLNNRFDHHQRDFKETLSDEHATKLSSAGLVYKHFGRDVIENCVNEPLSESSMQLIYLKLYKVFVEAIDGIDNGITPYEFSESGEVPLRRYIVSTDLSSRVGRLNPSWREESSGEDMMRRFEVAMQLVGSEFSSMLQYYSMDWLPARDIVLQAVEQRYSHHPSGQLLVLDQFAPWKQHLCEIEDSLKLAKPLLYVLYSDQAKKWRIQAVAVGDSFQSRKPLPESWRGLRDEELSKLTNIDNCIFVHASGFIGGNETYKGALAMAHAALSS